MFSQYSSEKKGLLFAIVVAISAVLAIIVVIVMPHSNKSYESDTVSDSVIDESESKTVLSKAETLLSIARAEEGTVGGLKYATWYTGFNENSHWCAIFVAWCAGQADLIEDGTIPKYALVTDYYSYYQELGKLFPAGSSKPMVGDLAFWDWEGDGQCDHIGIVVDVDDTYVYIINGNNGTLHPSQNIVKLSQCELNYVKLVAYARPQY